MDQLCSTSFTSHIIKNGTPWKLVKERRVGARGGGDS